MLIGVQSRENWHPAPLAGLFVLEQRGECGQSAPSHREVQAGQRGHFARGEPGASMKGQQPKEACRLRIQAPVRAVKAGADATSRVLQLI
jgi:hypothetical protein